MTGDLVGAGTEPRGFLVPIRTIGSPGQWRRPSSEGIGTVSSSPRPFGASDPPSLVATQANRGRALRLRPGRCRVSASADGAAGA